MKRLMKYGTCLLMLTVNVCLMANTGTSTSTSTSAGSLAAAKTLKIDRRLSADGKACITCHQQVSPGQVADWGRQSPRPCRYLLHRLPSGAGGCPPRYPACQCDRYPRCMSLRWSLPRCAADVTWTPRRSST